MLKVRQVICGAVCHVCVVSSSGSGTGLLYRPDFPVAPMQINRSCYCEILYWELQTVLQYQNSERQELSASVRRVSRLFSTV